MNPTCKKPAVLGAKLSDRWFVYFYYYDNEGKRKMYTQFQGLNDSNQTLMERREKSFNLLKELDEKLRTIPFDFATRTFIVPKPNTQVLQDYLDEYLKEVKDKVVYQTYINYNSVIRMFKTYVEGYTLEQVNKDFIKVFFKQLDIKPQSKRSYKICLSVFFNWLIEEKNLSIENPTHGVKIPNNLPVERHRVHSKADIQNVIKYCDEMNDPVMSVFDIWSSNENRRDFEDTNARYPIE